MKNKNKNKNKNKTKTQNSKLSVQKIKNGSRYELNGWICVSISGSAYNRGYAHGQLVKGELEKVREMIKYSLYEDLGRPIDVFIEMSNDFLSQK